jgi:hypothetical protein
MNLKEKNRQKAHGIQWQSLKSLVVKMKSSLLRIMMRRYGAILTFKKMIRSIIL